jgi:hypothetical protein
MKRFRDEDKKRGPMPLFYMDGEQTGLYYNPLLMIWNKLPDEDLLDLYSLFIRVEHYDPCETDETYVAYRHQGLTTKDIKNEIVKRMR